LTLYFSPDIAANAVIMTELAEELSALGHQVTVVTAFPHYARNVIDRRYRWRLFQRDKHRSIKVVRTYLYTSSRKRNFLGRILSYVSFNLLSTLLGLLSGKHDIILTPSPPLTIGLSAYIISRVKRIPYVYNVQDMYPDVVIKLGILKNPVGKALFHRLERFVYTHARHITVLSEGFRANLLRKGIPQQKLSVIPNFVDVDFVKPHHRNNTIRQRFGLDGRFVVLFAGNLGHSQDLEHVLECAALLRNHDHIAFVIVGNGSRKHQLEEQALRMDLDNVHFFPFQPHREVPDIYAAADIALVTLRKGIAFESFPSKAYSIMASARPILAAVDPGSDVWNLVEQASCGLCVEPENPPALAEAVLTLYEDTALRKTLARNGRKYVVRYHNRQVVAGEYHELLGSLTVRRGSEGMGIAVKDPPYKRFLDLSVLAAAHILLFPVWVLLWILIPLLIWLEDGTPIFYAQERLGLKGKMFRALKFRSMVKDAERDTGAIWAEENDPRVTRFGRMLRATALDELPQVINILRGEMSFVGPRAERPELSQSFTNELVNFRKRLVVRPGLTGMAQIYGKYDSPPTEKLHYDLLYIEKMNPWLDIRLLLLSLLVTLRGKWESREKKI
jgi:colanic acid biosynthesis glycosyl transferase WcaI